VITVLAYRGTGPRTCAEPPERTPNPATMVVPAAELAITLFGPPSVSSVDGLVRPELPGAFTLLAYLVVGHERVHPRAAVAGALWPDDDDDAARGKLRRHLHALTRALPAAKVPWIVGTGATLRWNPDARWRCDAVELDRALVAARGLSGALDLYAGDFLAGDEREWSVAQRERYRICAAETAIALARDAAEHGDQREALRLAQRAFAWEPDSDAIARTLIELLGAAGDRAGADAVYARFAERMRREYDAPPHAATVSAIERVRLAAVPAMRKLPADVTVFVGRAAESARALAALRESRLVTLAGQSGIGKTRLALHVAAAAAAAFPHGVVFVDCSSLVGGAPVDPAIAAALGIAADDLLAYLAERRMLLVIDGCDRTAVDALAAIVSGAPNAVVLATSLRALGLRAETVLRIGPMVADDAAALFVERGRRAAPEAGLETAPRAAVDAVCDALDRLPLAIELAAGQLDAIPLAEMPARLDDRFELLADDDPHAPVRHRALRAALAFSYAALGATDRGVLRRAALFADGWTFESGCAVCCDDAIAPAELRAALDRLVRSSMIEGAAGVEPRWRMLRTIRAFALTELGASGDAAQVHARYAAWAIGAAETIYAGSRDARQADVFALADAERANLREAIERALDADPAQARRLVGALVVYLDTRTLHADGRRWLERALRDGADGRALFAASTFTRTSDPQASLAYAQRAAVEYEARGDTAGVAMAHSSAALAHVYRGDVGAASAAAERSLSLRERHGDTHVVASALMTLAYIHDVRGEAEQAEAAFRRGLELAHRAGDSRLEVRALMSLSGCAFYSGEHRAARAYLERAIDLARAIGHETFLLHGLRNLGDVELASGRTNDALINYVESWRRARELGDTLSSALTLVSLAGALARSDPERAARLFGAAAALRERLPRSAEPAALVAEREAIRRLVIAALGEDAFAVAARLGRTYRDDDVARELAAVTPEAMPSD
jgi:predicted ATPase/DNA-binding SARP family transcriptional activator